MEIVSWLLWIFIYSLIILNPRTILKFFSMWLFGRKMIIGWKENIVVTSVLRTFCLNYLYVITARQVQKEVIQPCKITRSESLVFITIIMFKWQLTSCKHFSTMCLRTLRLQDVPLPSPTKPQTSLPLLSQNLSTSLSQPWLPPPPILLSFAVKGCVSGYISPAPD